jgi:protein-tyrosine phosphatase
MAQVMVHCMSGVSRSPSVVIAYLMKSNQWPLAQSLRYLQQRRPCVKLQPVAQEQLLEFERQVRSC